jgi:lipopolysaccharide/colanic/teichoic acid biosynthesis glycosyltransferase
LTPFQKEFIKRSGDIFLSSIVSVGILSWLIPIMALLIRLDSKGRFSFYKKEINEGEKLLPVLNSDR